MIEEEIEELSRKERIKIKAKNAAKKLKKELKKSFKTAVIAAFGFLIALSWKELITEIVNSITILNPLNLKIIEATIITLIAVFGIVIITTMLPDENEQK